MSNFYGQYQGSETDRLIEKYFPDNYIGTAIDVGATDGIFLSNTKHFEEKGWNVLCLEANPRYQLDLAKNRKYSMSVAIGNETKEGVDFTEIGLSGQNIHSSISSLRIDSDLFDRHLYMGFDLEKKNIKVNVMTLNDILKDWTPSKIDFLSIDTEGTELDVLMGFDIEKWEPRLFVIEANDENHSKRISNYMSKFDYRLSQRFYVNNFYVKKN